MTITVTRKGVITLPTCILCRYATALDDVVIGGPHGRCVCLHCYLRETGAARPLTRVLRHAVDAALAAAET